MTVRIAAFYKFFRFPDYAERRQGLARRFCGLGIKGTLLLAEEGVNGTIAGSPDAIDAALAELRARMKVRLKREIVTMGVPDIDPRGRSAPM
jgi:UPF0176 protein